MKNKKFWTLILAVSILFGTILTGCKEPEPEKTQYYYYEFFRITKTNYNSVALPSTATFSSIKNYRDRLKNYSVEFISSGTDATQDDIYSLMTQRGMSPTEANNEISFLNSVGNDVLYAQYTLDSNFYIIIYIEKL